MSKVSLRSGESTEEDCCEGDRSTCDYEDWLALERNRNDSFIMDLFARVETFSGSPSSPPGDLPPLKHFEAKLHLSAPIPLPASVQSIRVYFMGALSVFNLDSYHGDVPITATFLKVKNLIAKSKNADPYNILTFIFNRESFKLTQVLKEEDYITAISLSKDDIILYTEMPEFPSSCKEPTYVPVTFGKGNTSNTWGLSKPFFFPCCITAKTMQAYVDDVILKTIERNSEHFKVRIPEDTHIKKSYYLMRNGKLTIMEGYNEEIGFKSFDKVLVDIAVVNEKGEHLKEIEDLLRVSVHEEEIVLGSVSRAVSLYRCLDVYAATQPSYLSKNCKALEGGEKGRVLFKTFPKNIIIHLQRFGSHEHAEGMHSHDEEHHKNEQMVNFPVRGLDLSSFSTDEKETAIYDLYAVINHEGSCHNGRYTAVAFNEGLKEWHGFHNKLVKKVDEEQVCTSNAYILFYKRVESEGQQGAT